MERIEPQHDSKARDTSMSKEEGRLKESIGLNKKYKKSKKGKKNKKRKIMEDVLIIFKK